jgi:hypothetical protein
MDENEIEGRGSARISADIFHNPHAFAEDRNDRSLRVSRDPRDGKQYQELMTRQRVRTQSDSHEERSGHARLAPQELEQKFWKAPKSDMTMMLGLDGVEGGHARPMTAQLEHDDRGPIWSFIAKHNAIVTKLAQGDRAIAMFASKAHDLFATVHGTVRPDNDRAELAI